MEEVITDVEEKNKRLVDLLNTNLYNKAEQYKEKVLSKLQERNNTSNTSNAITPNKYASNASQHQQVATEPNE